MASIRSLLTSSGERPVFLVPAVSLSATAIHSVFNSLPLRQPPCNRMASSSSSSSSSSSTCTASQTRSTPVSNAKPISRALHSSTTSHPVRAVLSDDPVVTLPHHHADPVPEALPSLSDGMSAKPPLAILPLQTVLRSLIVTTLSSSPLLLPPSLAFMNVLAHTTSPILHPDHNPILRCLIKTTFYRQFCAGENATEVKSAIRRLKRLGFSGVILGYAKEVVLTEAQLQALESSSLQGEAMEEAVKNEVMPWAQATLETIRLAEAGDCVALKLTGAGRQAVRALSQRLAPPHALADAMHEICSLATSRGVRLLFDAEQQAVQHGVDDWALHYMRKYNASGAGKAVIYGTYQAYLRAMPAMLGAHLRTAQQEGFTLGVKLVRGAYLGSDPRHLLHDTKADTDAAYNGIAEALLRRKWMGPLAPHADSTKNFPEVNMVLASHNAESVRRGRAILEELGGRAKTKVAFAQLQGMADEVSCEILAWSRLRTKETAAQPLRAYKYLVWGSTGDCMKYLLRRAQENRDAVQRTRNGRNAMFAEAWRRLKAVLGFD